jgi:hypothetical protein
MSYLFLWSTGLGTVSVSMVLAEGIGHLLRGASRLTYRDIRASAVARAWASPLAMLLSAVAMRHSASELSAHPVFYGRAKADINGLADPIQRYLLTNGARRPLVRIATGQTWGIVAGVVLKLYKNGVDVSIGPRWLFMFGRQFALKGTADTVLVFGNWSFHEEVCTAPGYSFVAESNGVYAYVHQPE